MRTWTRRFWLVYSACWLPVVAFYTVTFLAQPRAQPATISVALLDAVKNVVPQYAMGVFVWWYSARRPWPRADLWRFLSAHVALAAVFAALWSWTVYLQLAEVPDARMVLRNVLPWQWLTGFTSYWVVAGLMFTVRGAARANALELAAEQADRLRAQAELAALRAHINPHFLFNALHAVGQLQRDEPARAEEAIERVSALFRYILRLDRHDVSVVSLEDEWRFTQDYLWLEQLRLGDRLVVCADFSEAALAADIPPFTLQPLVENAIRHGIAPSSVGGVLTLTACESHGRVQIVVRDDGVGASGPLDGAGVGLRAVRQRLEAQHNGQLRMAITPGVPRGFTVTLNFPAEGV